MENVVILSLLEAIRQSVNLDLYETPLYKDRVDNWSTVSTLETREIQKLATWYWCGILHQRVKARKKKKEVKLG